MLKLSAYKDHFYSSSGSSCPRSSLDVGGLHATFLFEQKDDIFILDFLYENEIYLEKWDNEEGKVKHTSPNKK